ncbi:MAG: hypothetical protein KJ795_11705 [Gammaproteobacteria bacterium]|nr:hypothetical protein [Gammaproteobacteria bacterium]MBU1776951.1 hypothetical protein [Gammaproteobacteria bacterium]MBU1968682.1 hypothetical protein [Gammaproteobacteria bacterium]
MKYLALSAMAYCVWIASAVGLLLVLFCIIFFSMARSKGMLGFIVAVVAIVASVYVLYLIDVTQDSVMGCITIDSSLASNA